MRGYRGNAGLVKSGPAVSRRTWLAGAVATAAFAAAGAAAQNLSFDPYAPPPDNPEDDELPREWTDPSRPDAPKPPSGPQGAWSRLADMLFDMQQTSAAAFPYELRQRGRVSSGVALVMAGGMTQDRSAPLGILDAVQYYLPQTDQWARGPRLPEKLHHLDLVAFDGALWAVGGYRAVKTGFWQMPGQTLVLGGLDGAWRRGPQTPLQSEGVVAALAGFLVYAGGRSPIVTDRNANQEDHRATDACWRMRRGGGWEPAGTMRVERASACGAVVDNQLFVFGGVTPSEGVTNRCEIYDPYSNRWRPIQPAPWKPYPSGPHDQSGMAAAAVGSNIYVMGGERYSSDGGRALTEVYEYDTLKDKWRSVAAMPRPRHGMGAATIGGEILVAGGSSGYGLAAPTRALDRFRI